MNSIDTSTQTGVHFSNFVVLENGEVEADIDIDDAFRLKLFEQRGWTVGVEADELQFDQYVNYCFQMMLHNMAERKNDNKEPA